MLIRPDEPNDQPTVRKAIFVATEDTNHGADYPRARSPIKTAAILLGIYIAMYLAVAGMVRVLTSPDALAATVPDTSTAPPANATPTSSPPADGQ